MGVKVVKFGGSSVADADQVRKIRDIVMADPERRYVVVSAPGKRFSKLKIISDATISDTTNVTNRAATRPIPSFQA